VGSVKTSARRSRTELLDCGAVSRAPGSIAITLIMAGLAWLTGLVAGLSLGAPTALIWPAGAATLGAGLAPTGSSVRLAAVALAAMLLGAWRASQALPNLAEGPLSQFRGQVVTLRGTVAEPPRCGLSDCRFVLLVEQIESASGNQRLDGKVQVRSGRAVESGFGRSVQARGELRATRPTLGFPSVELLARRGVHEVMDYPAVRFGSDQGPPPLGRLEALRAGLEQRLTTLVSGPEGQLAAGLVLGRDVSLTDELRAQLRATGTSHILAVSGFNVALIGGAVLGIGVRLVRRPRALALAAVTVAFYTLVVGAPPSAVRAALMLGAAGLASVVGRLPEPLTALVLAGAIMAALDPLVLLDLGFQLSFAATTGLVLLASRLTLNLGYCPRFLATALAATLAAQLFTLPLVLHTFHNVSLVSPLANVLIAPLIPLLMGCSIVTLAASWVPALGALFVALAWLIAHLMLTIIAWAAALPAATLATGHLPGWALLGAYGFIAVPLAMGHVRLVSWAEVSPVWRAAAAAMSVVGLATVAYAASLRPQPGGYLRALFFDVAGDGMTLVETPGGRRAVLASAGSPLAASALAEQFPLLDRTIDLLVVTRAGERDISGLAEVARRYPIGLVLQSSSGGHEAWWQWNLLLAERAIPSITATPGMAVWLDEQTLLEIEGSVEHESERPPSLTARLLLGSLDLRVAGGPLASRPVVDRTLVVRLAPELALSRELQAQLAATGSSGAVIGGRGSSTAQTAFPHIRLSGADVLELTTDGVETRLRRTACRPPPEPCSWSLGNAKGPPEDGPST
jgi:competence protein ComEC